MKRKFRLLLLNLIFIIVFSFSHTYGHERFAQLRKKVADEIDTTFSSKYTKTISLEETLHEENIFSYTKQATGEKFLIEPNN